MAWPTNPRPAKSLVTLRDQYNKKYPERSKASDGMLGDQAHQKTQSDHNPDSRGVVRAMDVSHDPTNGLDCNRESEVLVCLNPYRISYLIWDRRIWQGGVWKTYKGSNPHTEHMHISVNANNGDDASPWNIEEVKDMPLTPRQQDIAIKMFKGSDPTAEELNNKDYANNPGLMIETFWRNGGEARYKAAKSSQPPLTEKQRKGLQLLEDLKEVIG